MARLPVFSLLLCDGKRQVIHRGGSTSTSSCTTKNQDDNNQRRSRNQSNQRIIGEGDRQQQLSTRGGPIAHCIRYQPGGGLDARPPFAARPVDASAVWGKAGAGHARVCCRPLSKRVPQLARALRAPCPSCPTPSLACCTLPRFLPVTPGPVSQWCPPVPSAEPSTPSRCGALRAASCMLVLPSWQVLRFLAGAGLARHACPVPAHTPVPRPPSPVVGPHPPKSRCPKRQASPLFPAPLSPFPLRPPTSPLALPLSLSPEHTLEQNPVCRRQSRRQQHPSTRPSRRHETIEPEEDHCLSLLDSEWLVEVQ